jgi:hypothetical protein
MIERVGKNIRPHGRPPSPRQPRSYGTLGWSAAIFVLSVLPAIPLLPRAFGEPRSHAANQSTSNKEQRFGQPSISSLTAGKPSRLGPHVAAAMGSAVLTSQLPYDARPKAPMSQLPRGFHNCNDLLPSPSRGIGISADVRLAGSQYHEKPPQPSGTCPSTITQSTNQAVVTGAVACSDPGLGTLENHYWRAFDMNTFTGGKAYDVTSVEFGIEQALSLFGTDQPLTVNLYANHSSPFPGGDWQSNLLASSGEIRVPNQEFTVFNLPLTTTVPAGTLELVMEVLSPDQTVEHNFFIIGSNPDPETGPSYLSAPDCGNPDPVATRCIGFPDMHYVFNVNGTCAGGGPPTPTPTATPQCPPMVMTGTIDNSDPTQIDRLNRGVISGCCGTTYSCQIFGDGQPHHYDTYAFTNTTGSTQCVTVDITTDCQGSNFIFTAAYLGTFDPNDICTNWIADEGQSPRPGNTTPFSFNIEDGQTFVLVISEVTANTGCSSYTMTVSGLCSGGTPTPTPSATPTATATQTPTPTATARPIPTPRPHPTPRARPTPPTP